MDAKRASKQACDTCRRRKIKCSRELPCDKCHGLMLECSYSDTLRRKGPKFRTYYPLAPSHPLASRQRSFHGNATAGHGGDVNRVQPNIPSAASSCHGHQTPSSYVSPPPELSPADPEYASSHVARPFARRLTAPILLAHISVFLKYLFPIMPVVRRDELRRDSDHPDRVPVQRYAFLAALCAATHIQLKLDGAGECMSGEELLAEAVRARNECDPVEDMDVESLLTSFLLFASYGNLDKQRPAWFYLCQANSMAFSLGLHRESTYAGLSVEDAEEKRRVFWLLFVTERGYALQQAKPVMLRSSIQKPQVLCSDDPILAYGFINLISLFEKITPNLYDWISVDGDGNDKSASCIQSDLCNSPIASLQGVLEIQQVDILVTQQWLQAMMWKLSNGRSPLSAESMATLPFHLPIVVGKSVMRVIGAASQDALDAHGIGMEQKLFDLGSSIAKVTNAFYSTSPKPKSVSSLSRISEFIIEPLELLWGILTTLSRIRGSQSYLFPKLMEQCTSVLGLDCSVTLGNYLPPLPGTCAGNAVGNVAGNPTDADAAPTVQWMNPITGTAEVARVENENGNECLACYQT